LGVVRVFSLQLTSSKVEGVGKRYGLEQVRGHRRCFQDWMETYFAL